MNAQMSSLSRLLESRKTYAKQWKVVWWTLGMAFAVSLITDGKTVSPHPLLHLFMGAGLGLLLGLVFSRNLRANKAK
jgi:hypothetical protein